MQHNAGRDGGLLPTTQTTK